MTSELLLDRHDAAQEEERADSMDDLTSVQEVKAAIARLKGPKILQVLPSLGPGGVERGTLDISRYLIGQGWSPIVVSNGGEHEADLFEMGAISIKLPRRFQEPADHAGQCQTPGPGHPQP